MKVKTKDFLAELARFGINADVQYGRIVLSDGNDKAREHYSAILQASPNFEGALIWEIAQTNPDVMYAIEERRAIRWVECGDDSIRSAIICNITS